MPEWLIEINMHLITNIQFLFNNPTGSTIIFLLRILSLILFLRFLIKVIIHVFIFTKLKKKFPSFEDLNNHNILDIYYMVCEKIKLKRKPPLFPYRENRPLIFSIGLFRPVIFFSPYLIKNLSNDEIKTVLVHELHHIKKKDSLWIWLFDIFTIFIPLITILLFGYFIVFKIIAPVLFLILTILMVFIVQKFVKKHLLFLRELRCDDRTIQIIKDPLLLATTLIKVWTIGNKLQKSNSFFSLSQVNPLLTASQRVESRIKRLSEYRLFSKRTLVKKTVLVFTLLILVISGIFFWKFFLFYKNTNIKNTDGKIIVKTINTEDDEQLETNSNKKRIIRKKLIKKEGGE